MKFKPLLGIVVAVAAGVCLGAVIRHRRSEQVIKLKREEGWALAAVVNNSFDVRHPWNILQPERIWFVKPDTLTHVNDNVVAVRVLMVDPGVEDVSVLAFDCTDRKAAFPAAGEYDPLKFQWRNYEPVFTKDIAEIVCR